MTLDGPSFGEEYEQFVVRDGDRLAELLRYRGITMKEIGKVNPALHGLSAGIWKAGQVVNLPPSEYTRQLQTALDSKRVLLSEAHTAIQEGAKTLGVLRDKNSQLDATMSLWRAATLILSLPYLFSIARRLSRHLPGGRRHKSLLLPGQRTGWHKLGL
jgi:hypothetical protein